MQGTPSSIQAITFDVGSTFIYPHPSVDQVFYRIETDLGHHIPLKTIQRHMDDVDAFYERAYQKNGDFWCTPEGSSQIWIDMYAYLSHLVGLDDDAQHIGRTLYHTYCEPAFWKPYDDVLDTLRVLARQHYRLGIISNWGSELAGILDGLHLSSYFDVLCISADVGMRKPHSDIFSFATHKLGIEPRHIIHVGDLPDVDGDGAHALGMYPIIIDRHNRYTTCSYQTVSSLCDIPDYIMQAFPKTSR